MKKITPLLLVSFLFNSLPVLGEQSVEVLKSYSRGDDDKEYVYSTADLNTSLRLKKVASGYDAQVSFAATLTTAEAQGFAESVRFGMREAERTVTSSDDDQARALAVTTKPVVFKFIQSAANGSGPDNATQQSAEALSSEARRNNGVVRGNRPEAMGKTLGGTLNLGILSEGDHHGTIFVQQLLEQTPSVADTDISVRHLIRWHAKVQDGRVYVEVQNGRYFASDANVEIAAPSWDGTVRPHRVALTNDRIILDGHTIPSGTAQYGSVFEEKGATLLDLDKQEFRQEFSARERRDIRRANKR